MKWYIVAKEYSKVGDSYDYIEKVQCATDDLSNAYIFRDAYNKEFAKALTSEMRAYIVSKEDLVSR